MLRVALTGGIGTGKSYVAGRLPRRGVPVVDADRLAREVGGAGHSGARRDCRSVRSGVLDEDGALRPAGLAALVFADARPRAGTSKRSCIPPCAAASTRSSRRCRRRRPFAVADIPLLFETGRAADFDVVVVAACPPEMQVARVMARDGVTEAEVRQRMAAQWPIEEKVQRADYVIDTERLVRGRPTPRSVASVAWQRAPRGAALDDAEPSHSAEVCRRRRCAPRRTSSTRGSADIATAARCCGSGTSGRRADRGRTRRRARPRCSAARARDRDRAAAGRSRPPGARSARAGSVRAPR